MAGDTTDYPTSYNSTDSLKIRDLEERQRILRDQVRLIGENLIEMRNKNEKNIIELKKNFDIIKENVQKLTSFLEMATNEFSKFAKKDDLEILSKQARMFQPLELARKMNKE